MFIDHTIIHCIAGSGGKGCNSFIRSRHMKHRKPNGGDGGDGGSVILQASKDAHTLLDLQMTKTFRSDAGKHGGSNHMNGAHGENRIVMVPLGTEVFDEATGHLLADLCKVGQEVSVAHGGAGGKGNHRKSEALPGDAGEDKMIRLELKLIADVGLVGFPNAGKSTLISRVSNAKSRIEAYPFTTKEPVLGVVKSDYGDSFVVADIPGLIEGAHDGKGMGDKFLKHIERTHTFLHMIDMAAVDNRNPVQDYKVIQKELSAYFKDFKSRPCLLVANKMDVPEARENLVKFKQHIKEEIHEISAVTGQGLSELKKILFERLS